MFNINKTLLIVSITLISCKKDNSTEPTKPVGSSGYETNEELSAGIRTVNDQSSLDLFHNSH